MTLLLEARLHAPDQHIVLPLAQARVLGRVVVHRPGQVVLVVGAVGGVAVDQEIRIPLVDQGQQCTHLRRVGLDVVAIQVQALAGGAPTHLDRPVLVDAIEHRATLVAIEIEDRHEHQRDVIEPAQDALVLRGDFRQQDQARVLALDFAGVDAGLHEHDFAAGFRLTHDDDLERATFGRGAEGLHADAITRRIESVDECKGRGRIGRAQQLFGFGGRFEAFGFGAAGCTQGKK